MREIANFLKASSRPAVFLTVAACALLLVKVLYLNDMPEGFAGAHDLGIIAEGVLGSVVASYIFYIMVVHLHDWQDKRVVAPFIRTRSRRVYGDCEATLAALAQVTGASLSLETITLDQSEAVFAAIGPYSAAPMVIGPEMNNATWVQYFVHQMERSKDSVSKVLSQLRFLDSALVAKLVAIDECTFFVVVRHSAAMIMENRDMTFAASNFQDYCDKCRDLKLYLSREV